MVSHFYCLTSLETPTCQLLLLIPMLAQEGFHQLPFLQLKESLANTAGTTAASAVKTRLLWGHQLGPTALLWLSNSHTGTSSCPGNPPTHLRYVSNNEVQVPLPAASPSSRPPASSLSDWPLPFCLVWTPQATIQVSLSPSQGLLSPSNFSDPTHQFSASDFFSLISTCHGLLEKSTISARLPTSSVVLSTYLALPCGSVCYCLLISFTSFSLILMVIKSPISDWVHGHPE